MCLCSTFLYPTSKKVLQKKLDLSFYHARQKSVGMLNIKVYYVSGQKRITLFNIKELNKVLNLNQVFPGEQISSLFKYKAKLL